MIPPLSSISRRVRNATMDVASHVIYRIDPYRAGQFDAWCDQWRWS